MTNALSVETIDIEDHLRMTLPDIVDDGKGYYDQGKVSLEYLDTQRATLLVSEDAKTTYRVNVRLNSDNKYRKIEIQCNCKQRDRWRLCSHSIAALLLLHDHLAAHPPSRWKGVLGPAVHGSDKAGKGNKTNKTSKTGKPGRDQRNTRDFIVFSLQCKKRWDETIQWEILPYILPDVAFFPQQEQEAITQAIQEGGAVRVRQARQRISPQDYPHIPTEVVAAANLTFGASSQSSYASTSGVASYLESVLALLPYCVVYQGTEKEPLQRPIHVFPDAGRIGLSLGSASSGLLLTPLFMLNDTLNESLNDPSIQQQIQQQLTPQTMQIVVRDPLWVLTDSLLLRFDDPSSVGASLIEHPELFIEPHEQEEFLESYLLPLADRVPVDGDIVQWAERDVAPTPRLYLTEAEGSILFHLRFDYGGYEVPFEHEPPPTSIQVKAYGAEREAGNDSKPESNNVIIKLARIQRWADREAATWQNLTMCGLRATSKKSTTLTLRKESEPVDFLMHQVPQLVQEGYEIYGEQNLSISPINRSRPRISFHVRSGIDWFDVRAVVNFGKLEASLKEIRRAIRKRETYVKLSDGSIGALPQEWIERYRHLFDLGREVSDGIRISHSQIALLEDALTGADAVQSDAQFESRRQRLRDFSRITPQRLPKGFTGVLRPYQKAGYDWLHFLHEYGFGGCLADDMGTGKTIQTLAFLQSLNEKNSDGPASLVVVPRSLLFNWEREAGVFTPALRVFVHADNSRVQEPSEFGIYDLVLTTYGTMLRDVDTLSEYLFETIILDEAQAIKNPVAETSKAVRRLQARHRLTLTGTPIENSTLELWSQFAFLNPGMLGKLEYFRREFVTPIEQKQDKAKAQLLRKMVFPFILRRTKEQVAADLPPRTERVLVCEMEPEQRAFYEQQRDYYRGLLLGLIEEEGMSRARFKILEWLLRLRQICNHPRLVDGEYQGGSAKFTLLLETLETLRAEGHRALIFSQFVQMLSLVREVLDNEGVPYAYLDGQTRNREAVVEQFQNNADLPFFLISLKAGGVGLNLTAADYVIHVDPWWNPAVEMQASDRAHRIGQDKPVFVYKLVVHDSVEEKVLQLQERKRAVVQEVVVAEEEVFKHLSSEDMETLLT